jgi:hypothetical protein
MRPTDPNRIMSFNKNSPGSGIDATFPEETALKNKEDISEIWLTFAERALSAMASNPDITTNNRSDYVTDEAALMADRMLAHHVQRFGPRSQENSSLDQEHNDNMPVGPKSRPYRPTR